MFERFFEIVEDLSEGVAAIFLACIVLVSLVFAMIVSLRAAVYVCKLWGI